MDINFLPSTQRDFDKMAAKIADTFLVEGISPTEQVIKVSSQESLKPEEVRRLTEKTNTIVTVKLIKAANSSDVTIPIVDYEQVVATTHPTTVKVAAETRSGGVPKSLPNTVDIFAAQPLNLGHLVKSASTESAKSTKPSLRTVFRLEKEVEELTRKKTAQYLKTQDHMDYIISEFSVWNAPDFNKFASEVLHLRGDLMAPVMEKVADYLGTKLSLEKVAHVVDDTTVLHKKAEQIATGILSILDLEKQMVSTKEKLASSWADIKNC